VFFKIFLQEIEPNLGKDRPVFLYDYPAQLASLARTKKDDPRYAERFELYIGGLEIANAFSELTDAGEQKRRLKAEQSLRQTDGKLVYDIDEDFLAAQGTMPESAGMALGIDRLLMVLLDAPKIEDVLCFPASSLF
jgi:lysyl-tRNA synthetase class 2